MRHKTTIRARRGHEGAGQGLEPLEPRCLLAADLSLESISTLNAVVSPGNSFQGTFVVKNVGDAATTPFRVEFRLSRNTTWGDADDVILGFRHVNAPIFGGGQTTLQETFDLPRNVATGNYHLAALADSLGQIAEPDENNNLRFTPVAQIIVANPAGQQSIDLQATGVAATGGTYNAGQAFPGAATYRNNGTAPSGPFVTIWFLSTNQIFGDADDIILATATSNAGLQGGQAFNDSFQLTIPINAPSGSYFFGVFVDARFDINEPLLEDNNIGFSATPAVNVVGAQTVPDLLVDGVTTQQAVYFPGEEITFSVTIRNAGNAVAGAFKVTYALTTDSTLGNSDDVVLLFKAALPSLGAGATTTDTRTLMIPLGATPGEYFLGVQLDPDNEVAESNETNNIGLTTTRLVGISAPPPQVADITVLGGGSLNQLILHNTKAQRAKGTGYGPVVAETGDKTITYRIRNTGLSDLIITLIEPRGQVPGDYEIIAFPSSTIAPGESSNFTVRFSPTLFGTRRANIAIFTNDPDRPRFTMKIAGRGVPPASAPDIDVRGNGNSISDNDRKARPNTGTRFGAVALGGTVLRTYTIRNAGQSTLTLLSPLAGIGGQNPTQFSIVVAPSLTTLEPGQSTTFTVAFTPTTAGQKKAEVEIYSDDPDEGVFNYRIIGTGL